MKNIFILILILPTVAFCQSWEKVYEGCEGNSVQQTTDGGYIVAGSKGSWPRVYLVKCDEFGDTLWTKTIEGAGGRGYPPLSGVCNSAAISLAEFILRVMLLFVGNRAKVDMLLN